MAQPQVGEMIDGYRFNGGDPSSQDSWSQGPKAGDVVDGYKFNGGDPNEESSWSAAKAESKGILSSVADLVGFKVPTYGEGKNFKRPEGQVVTENTFTAGMPEEDIKPKRNIAMENSLMRGMDGTPATEQTAALSELPSVKKVSQPVSRFERQKEANRKWLDNSKPLVVDQLISDNNLSPEDADVEFSRMRSAGVVPSATESGLRESTWGEAFDAGLAKVKPSFDKSMAGLASIKADVTGDFDLANVADALRKTANERLAEADGILAGTSKDSWKKTISDAPASIAQNLPTIIAASAVASNPLLAGVIGNIGLAGMGMVSAGTAYAEGKDTGLNVSNNMQQSVLTGLAEVIPEKMSLNVLIGALGKDVAKKAMTDSIVQSAKTLGKYIGAEIGTEELTTIANFGINKMYSKPDMPMKELVSQMIDTAKATLIQAPILGGAGIVTKAAVDGAGRIIDPTGYQLRGYADAVERTNFAPMQADGDTQAADAAKASTMNAWSNGFAGTPKQPAATAAPTPSDVLAAPNDIDAITQTARASVKGAVTPTATQTAIDNDILAMEAAAGIAAEVVSTETTTAPAPTVTQHTIEAPDMQTVSVPDRLNITVDPVQNAGQGVPTNDQENRLGSTNDQAVTQSPSGTGLSELPDTGRKTTEEAFADLHTEIPGVKFNRVEPANIPARAGESSQATVARQQEASVVEKLFGLAGTQVHYVTTDTGAESFGGAILRSTPGHIFVDVNNKSFMQDAIRVRAAHEALHDLKLRNEDLYDGIVNQLRAVGAAKLSMKQFQPIYDKTGAVKIQDQAHATEEQVANLFGNIMSDPAAMQDLLQRISGGDMSVAAKVVAAFRNAIAAIKKHLTALGTNYDTSRYEGDLNSAQKILMDSYVAFAKAQGKNRLDAEISVVQASKGIKQSPAKKPGSDAGHKRESDGRYVGAPDWVGNNPMQLVKMRKTLNQLAKEGDSGRYWYEKSSKAVMDMVGGDKAAAEKFVGLLAIYSQGTSVPANTAAAIKAWAQWKAGVKIDAGRFPEAMGKKATTWLNTGKDWGGIKTNNFYQDLMEEIDPSKVDHGHSTMDMWMALAFDYGSKVLDQGPKYLFAQREIAKVAKEMGWKPHQVQAAIWSSIKTRVESSERLRNERELAAGIRVMGKEGMETAKGREYEHFRLAHQLGMEHDFDGRDPAEVIKEKGEDFSDAMRKRSAQMSLEAIPGSATGLLPGIHTATMAQQEEYLAEMRKAFSTASGSDIIDAELGHLINTEVKGFSGWKGVTNTGLQRAVTVQTDSHGGTDKNTVVGNTRDFLDLSAAIHGLVWTQDGVAWHFPLYSGAKNGLNGVEFKIGRLLTQAESDSLYQALSKELGHTFSPPIPTTDGLGFRVLNFPDEKFALAAGVKDAAEKKALQKSQTAKNEEFASSVGSAVKAQAWSADVADVARFESDGSLVENDWSNGDVEYRKEIGRVVSGFGARSWAGRSDIFEWIDLDLRPKADAVNATFSKKYGWGKAKFSPSRSDAASDGRAGRLVESGVSEVSSYGRSSPGAVEATGIHYSGAERNNLDGRYYGTGARGKEADRVRAATDPRIKERIYFYVDSGKGVTPEQGVGSVPHSVNLKNLYDGNADTWIQKKLDRNLKDGEWDSAFESAVIDAGFDGYVSDFGTQRAAVLLGRHNVPVTAGKSTVASQRKAGAVNESADAVEQSRILPGGQMSGADWKKMIPAVVPGASVDMLQDGKDYYKSDVVAAMRGTKFSPARQSDTPEFKKWFGDSNLRNEDGSPMVLYHGTNKDFSVFKSSKTGVTGAGVYLGIDTGTADSYAGDDSGSNVMPVYARGRYIGMTEWSKYVQENGGWAQGRAKAEADGVAGIIDLKIENAVNVFDPNNLKSAIGNSGAFDGSNPDIRFSPGRFYSQLERAVEQTPDRIFNTAPQFKMWLNANAAKLGIKKDEMEWTGIGEYLDTLGKGKVSKADVLGFLKANGVQVDEVEKGKLPGEPTVAFEDGKWVVRGGSGKVFGKYNDEEDANAAKPRAKEYSLVPTKYSQYVLPGGENYRELLLTLPEKHVYPKTPVLTSEESRRFSTLTQKMRQDGNLPAAEMADWKALKHQRDKHNNELEDISRAGQNQKPYRSSHWEEDNILAHVRFNDRTDADGAKVLFIEELQSDAGQGKRDGKVDWNAPFIGKTEAWLGLGIKRMIAYAVENGYQKVAFVNGEQSADRYSLAKKISRLEWKTTPGESNGVLIGWDANGNGVLEKEMAPSEVEDYAGKELADRLVNGPVNHETARGRQVRRVEGADLKVGGEGMKAFYNTIVPQTVNDVLKRLGGGKVESVVVPIGDPKNTLGYTFETVGQEPSWAEIESVLAVTKRSGPDIFINPLNGERLGYSLNRVTPDGNLRLVKAAMEGGKSFTDAFSEYGDDFLGQIFGVELRKVPAKTKASDQTGFTITPSMREKVEQGMPLFSPQRAPVQTPWATEATGKIDKIIYEAQDKFVDLKRVRNAIKEAGIQVREEYDAYVAEELNHGRAAYRVQLFLEQEFDPLLEEMKMRGVKTEEFDKYLHARHAKERNKAMAKANPNQAELDTLISDAEDDVHNAELDVQMTNGGQKEVWALQRAQSRLNALNVSKPFSGTEEERQKLSGMSNAEADQVLASSRATLEPLAKKVDAIVSGTRSSLAGYGLETQDTVDSMAKAYKHYVPLFREMDDSDLLGTGGNGTGSGYSIKGSTLKRATGSLRAVEPILANLMAQREQAIVRGEKALVGKSLYAMALSAPNPDFWSVIRPNMSAKDMKAAMVAANLDPALIKTMVDAPMEAYIDDNTGVVRFRANPMIGRDPNAVVVRVAGEDRVILFNSENDRAVRLASALKNLDSQSAIGPIKAINNGVGQITRYISAINTQYNPIFGIKNFIRDFQGAGFNLSTTPIAGQEVKVLGHVGNAIRAIYRQERGKSVSNQAWSDMWTEFRESGAETGYMDSFNNLEDRVGAIQKHIKGRNLVMQGIGPVLDLLGDYNTAIENGVRLSAYKTARESGLSKIAAASMAKNLTVNFNRKGRTGGKLSGWYAFFNAAVQGNARIAETFMAGHKGKAAGLMAAKLGSAGIGIGALLAVIGIAMMGDDWDDIPDFVRSRDFIIPLGKMDAEGANVSKTKSGWSYLHIPMALGYHVFPGIGRTMVEMAMLKRTEAGKRMGNLLGEVIGALNPMGAVSIADKGWGGVAEALAPSFADPVLQLANNQNAFGRPIAKTNFSEKDPTPAPDRFFRSASNIGKGVSKGLDRVSGGDGAEPGKIQLTPDQIDYIFGQLTGGVGRESLKLYQYLESKATDSKIPESRVPIKGMFYGETKSEQSVTGKYHDIEKKINIAENGIKLTNTDAGRAKYTENHPEVNLVPAMRSATGRLSKINKARKAADARGDKAEVKRLDSEATGIRTLLIDRYYDMDK